MRTEKKQKLKQLRRYRIRKKVAGSSVRPRMAVCFTNENIHVQFIDDDAGVTLAAASTVSKTVPKETAANVAGAKIDEVFIGSCMTNIGHFRAASKLLENKRDIPVKLWMAPPTKMDAKQLSEEGHYGVLGSAGARMEMPGCSLCMGNQAQVREGATVFSTSTRNFPNRLGKNSYVYLGSAELAAICSKLGRIPTKDEYMADMGVLTAASAKVYQYLNFDRIGDYTEAAAAV